MTTSFRQRGSSGVRIWLVRMGVPLSVAALAILALVLDVPVPSGATGALHKAVGPFWAGRNDLVATVVASYEALESKDALVRENITLHEELSRLRREAYGAGLLRTENERLRAMLGRAAEEAQVAAVVVDRDRIPYDAFVVDSGENNGVREGALVASPEGIALGFADRVFAETTNVRSFSAPGQVTPVVLGTSSPLLAEAVGKGAGTYTITLPRDVSIATGTPVALQMFEPYVLGYVDEIVSAPEQPFQNLYLRTPKALTQMRFVAVSKTQWSRDDTEGPRSE